MAEALKTQKSNISRLENLNSKISPTLSTIELWIQPIDATHWLNRSAGVSKSSVSRGRSV
jgi:hypothetical protein